MKEKETVVITTTLPREIYRQIEVRATATHTSKASVIRHVVCEYFTNDERLQDETHA
jgi:hypothetical protein